MATPAAGYILLVPLSRRDSLLDAAAEFEGCDIPIAEPVNRFTHSKWTPLVVLASFEDNHITHLFNGKKGMSAGTGLVRLNLLEGYELKPAISFKDLAAAVPQRLRASLRSKLEQGGVLTSKTFAAVIAALLKLRPQVSTRLARFSEDRSKRIARIPEQSQSNLALQKEALTVSLSIAGMNRGEVLSWAPADGEMHSFLDGLPGAQVREDIMLAVDHGVVPDFDFGKSTHVASKVFYRASDNTRLTVIMANRTPLERYPI